MKTRSKSTFLAFFVLVLFLLSGTCAPAANFDIQPIKIYLDAKTRIEKLTIRNVSDNDFPLQIRVLKWAQNEKGEDVYSQTDEIIFFPKILTLKKGDEKIVRIGTNLMPGATEKTYRVYVEEMPSDSKVKEGATVRMYMKIGIPIFIAPVKKEEKGRIESVALKDGKASVKITNMGNVHFVPTSISLAGENEKGAKIFGKELSGWYILNGFSKSFDTAVPKEVYADLKRLEVKVKAGGLVLSESFPVGKAAGESK